MTKNNSLLTEEQKAELDKRSRLYRGGKLKVFTWNEVKEKARIFKNGRSGL